MTGATRPRVDSWAANLKSAGYSAATTRRLAVAIVHAPALKEALEGILKYEHRCTCPSRCDGMCWHAIGLRALALMKGSA